MSPEDCKRSREQRPPSLQHIQDQIRSACEDLIHCCSQEIDIRRPKVAFEAQFS